MLSRFVALATLSITALSAFSSTAQAENIMIHSLYCTTFSPMTGTTSLVSTGSFMGKGYLNFSNISVFGVPGAQQAEVLSTSRTSNGVAIDMKMTISGDYMTLLLNSGTNQGLLTMGGKGLPMYCTSVVEFQ